MSRDFEFDIDLDDLPNKLLRKIIRSGLGKRARKKMEQARCEDGDCEDEDEELDEAEEEREKLSRLAEEKRGEAPKVEVTKDDLPAGVASKLARKKKSS